MVKLTNTLILLFALGVVALADTEGKEQEVVVETEENPLKKEPLIYMICPESCYFKVFVSHSYDKPCLKFIFVKLLGFAIVIGASIVKVPQIIKILVAGKTTGMADSMFYFEVLSYGTNTLYSMHNGHPFSAYGENFFLVIQSSILLFILWIFNRGKYSIPKMVTHGGIFALYLGVLFEGSLVSESMWWLCYSLCFPIAMTGRLEQIYVNWKNKSTGELSFIMIFLYVGGCGSRVFTTLNEVADTTMLSMTIIAFFVNLALLFQLIIYWNSKPKLQAKQA